MTYDKMDIKLLFKSNSKPLVHMPVYFEEILRPQQIEVFVDGLPNT